MARPMNQSPVPEHPSITTYDPPAMKRIYGHSVPAALVKCPNCDAERWYPYGTLRQWAAKETFTGRCRPCNVRLTREFGRNRAAGKVERRVLPSGYVVIYLAAANKTPQDRAMFHAMKNRAHYVFEHRWVMAKHLGRPLGQNELIDHMDGVKGNNAVDNLRIYVRGKQQPGSTNGYGTYYHEWQMALLEIEQLRAVR